MSGYCNETPNNVLFSISLQNYAPFIYKKFVSAGESDIPRTTVHRKRNALVKKKCNIFGNIFLVCLIDISAYVSCTVLFVVVKYQCTQNPAV